MDCKSEVEVKVDLSSLDSGESQAKVRSNDINEL
jgi:polyisoprenoid-binding protein YceI